MPRIKLKQVDGISRKLVSDAFTAFMRHCQLKNLSPYTYRYYKENVEYFLEASPEVTGVVRIAKSVIALKGIRYLKTPIINQQEEKDYGRAVLCLREKYRRY